MKIKKQTAFNLLVLAVILALTSISSGAWPVTLAAAALGFASWKLPKRGGRRR